MTIEPNKKQGNYSILKSNYYYFATILILLLLPFKSISAETLLMTVTAYDNCRLCTGKTPVNKSYGITKSGKIASYGTISVDPRIIPRGTKLKIEGFRNKIFIAEDTGRAIKGN